jgi:flagellar biosynthesis/type III secretory pathway protein FliH
MSSEEQQTITDPLRPHVRTFRPSTFQASEFEVVAESTVITEFAADKFTVVEGPPRTVDPMFDVYDDLVIEVQGFVEDELSAEAQLSTFEVDIVVEEDIPGEVIPLPVDVTADLPSEQDSLTVASEPPIEQEQVAEEPVAEESVAEEPVVLGSEVELLTQNFEEERIALQVHHERQVEEISSSLREQIEARLVAESEERIKAIEERYRTIIDDMSGQIRDEVEAVERRAVEFALQVARKLVGTTVEINPEYILHVIKDAMNLTGGATIKVIRVSPQDLEFLKKVGPERQFKEFNGSWSFQGDDTIRAGCVLETSSGEVELDLEKAWERIKESVTKVR